MICVTRLDRQEILVNCDLIEMVESHPDTTLRLTTGQSLVVRETRDEIVERVLAWRATVMERSGLPALAAQFVHPAAAEPAAADTTRLEAAARAVEECLP
jgi:flagellar protein FlbD